MTPRFGPALEQLAREIDAAAVWQIGVDECDIRLGAPDEVQPRPRAARRPDHLNAILAEARTEAFAERLVVVRADQTGHRVSVPTGRRAPTPRKRRRRIVTP